MAWPAMPKAPAGAYGIVTFNGNTIDRLNHLFNGTYIKTDLVDAGSILAGAVGQSEIANSAVGYGELKTTVSVVTCTAGAAGHFTPVNTAFAFSPRFYAGGLIGTADEAKWISSYPNVTLGTAEKLVIFLDAGAFETLGATFYYVQASPPYRVAGDPDWGMFIFILREKATGSILALTTAEDPPWAGTLSMYPRNHPARIAGVPHPFADYHGKALPPDLEIVMVDCRAMREEIRETPHNDMYDHLVLKRSEFKALGMTDLAIAQGEADQEDLAHTEHLVLAEGERRLERARARVAKLAALPNAKPLAVSRALRHVQCARRMAGHAKRWEKIQREARLEGKTLNDLILDGAIPEIANATHELPAAERALLPQVPAFASAVTVLQAR